MFSFLGGLCLFVFLLIILALLIIVILDLLLRYKRKVVPAPTKSIQVSGVSFNDSIPVQMAILKHFMVDSSPLATKILRRAQKDFLYSRDLPRDPSNPSQPSRRFDTTREEWLNDYGKRFQVGLEALLRRIEAPSNRSMDDIDAKDEFLTGNDINLLTKMQQLGFMIPQSTIRAMENQSLELHVKNPILLASLQRMIEFIVNEYIIKYYSFIKVDPDPTIAHHIRRSLEHVVVNFMDVLRVINPTQFILQEVLVDILDPIFDLIDVQISRWKESNIHRIGSGKKRGEISLVDQFLELFSRIHSSDNYEVWGKLHPAAKEKFKDINVLEKQSVLNLLNETSPFANHDPQNDYVFKWLVVILSRAMRSEDYDHPIIRTAVLDIMSEMGLSSSLSLLEPISVRQLVFPYISTLQTLDESTVPTTEQTLNDIRVDINAKNDINGPSPHTSPNLSEAKLLTQQKLLMADQQFKERIPKNATITEATLRLLTNHKHLSQRRQQWKKHNDDEQAKLKLARADLILIARTHFSRQVQNKKRLQQHRRITLFKRLESEECQRLQDEAQIEGIRERCKDLEKEIQKKEKVILFKDTEHNTTKQLYEDFINLSRQRAMNSTQAYSDLLEECTQLKTLLHEINTGGGFASSDHESQKSKIGDPLQHSFSFRPPPSPPTTLCDPASGDLPSSQSFSLHNTVNNNNNNNNMVLEKHQVSPHASNVDPLEDSTSYSIVGESLSSTFDQSDHSIVSITHPNISSAQKADNQNDNLNLNIANLPSSPPSPSSVTIQIPHLPSLPMPKDLSENNITKSDFFDNDGSIIPSSIHLYVNTPSNVGTTHTPSSNNPTVFINSNTPQTNPSTPKVYPTSLSIANSEEGSFSLGQETIPVPLHQIGPNFIPLSSQSKDNLVTPQLITSSSTSTINNVSYTLGLPNNDMVKPRAPNGQPSSRAIMTNHATLTKPSASSALLFAQSTPPLINQPPSLLKTASFYNSGQPQQLLEVKYSLREVEVLIEKDEDFVLTQSLVNFTAHNNHILSKQHLYPRVTSPHDWQFIVNLLTSSLDFAVVHVHGAVPLFDGHSKPFSGFDICLTVGKFRWSIRRRFSNLLSLHSALKAEFGKEYDLTVHNRRLMNFFDGAKAAQERCQDTENYLNDLLKRTHLLTSPASRWYLQPILHWGVVPKYDFRYDFTGVKAILGTPPPNDFTSISSHSATDSPRFSPHHVGIFTPGGFSLGEQPPPSSTNPLNLNIYTSINTQNNTSTSTHFNNIESQDKSLNNQSSLSHHTSSHSNTEQCSNGRPSSLTTTQTGVFSTLTLQTNDSSPCMKGLPTPNDASSYPDGVNDAYQNASHQIPSNHVISNTSPQPSVTTLQHSSLSPLQNISHNVPSTVFQIAHNEDNSLLRSMLEDHNKFLPVINNDNNNDSNNTDGTPTNIDNDSVLSSITNLHSYSTPSGIKGQGHIGSFPTQTNSHSSAMVVPLNPITLANGLSNNNNMNLGSSFIINENSLHPSPSGYYSPITVTNNSHNKHYMPPTQFSPVDPRKRSSSIIITPSDNSTLAKGDNNLDLEDAPHLQDFFHQDDGGDNLFGQHALMQSSLAIQLPSISRSIVNPVQLNQTQTALKGMSAQTRLRQAQLVQLGIVEHQNLLFIGNGPTGPKRAYIELTQENLNDALREIELNSPPLESSLSFSRDDGHFGAHLGHEPPTTLHMDGNTPKKSRSGHSTSKRSQPVVINLDDSGGSTAPLNETIRINKNAKNNNSSTMTRLEQDYDMHSAMMKNLHASSVIARKLAKVYPFFAQMDRFAPLDGLVDVHISDQIRLLMLFYNLSNTMYTRIQHSVHDAIDCIIDKDNDLYHRQAIEKIKKGEEVDKIQHFITTGKTLPDDCLAKLKEEKFFTSHPEQISTTQHSLNDPETRQSLGLDPLVLPISTNLHAKANTNIDSPPGVTPPEVESNLIPTIDQNYSTLQYYLQSILPQSFTWPHSSSLFDLFNQLIHRIIPPIAEIDTTAVLLKFVDKLFDLHENSFMRRRLVWIVKVLLQFAGTSSLDSTIEGLFSAEAFAGNIDYMVQMLCGYRSPPSPEVSPQSFLQHFSTFISHYAGSAFGIGSCESAALKLTLLMQSPILLNHVIYTALDKMLIKMYPDIENEIAYLHSMEPILPLSPTDPTNSIRQQELFSPQSLTEKTAQTVSLLNPLAVHALRNHDLMMTGGEILGDTRDIPLTSSARLRKAEMKLKSDSRRMNERMIKEQQQNSWLDKAREKDLLELRERENLYSDGDFSLEQFFSDSNDPNENSPNNANLIAAATAMTTTHTPHSSENTNNNNNNSNNNNESNSTIPIILPPVIGTGSVPSTKTSTITTHDGVNSKSTMSSTTSSSHNHPTNDSSEHSPNSSNHSTNSSHRPTRTNADDIENNNHPPITTSYNQQLDNMDEPSVFREFTNLIMQPLGYQYTKPKHD